VKNSDAADGGVEVSDTTPGEMIDGYTLDELADYLDRGQRPRDPGIDDSPACQIALAGLRRLRRFNDTFLDDEAAAEPPRDESWISALLENLRVDAHAGRSVPIAHPDPEATLSVTEGAVKDLIRRAGDDIGGVLIGKIRLQGDVTVPGEPIDLDVEATVAWGENIPSLAPLIRTAVLRDLCHHTDLVVVAADVTITDVYVPEEEQA